MSLVDLLRHIHIKTAHLFSGRGCSHLGGTSPQNTGPVVAPARKAIAAMEQKTTTTVMLVSCTLGL